MTFGSGTKATIAPDDEGVRRRQTAQKIRAQFLDCTLLFLVCFKFPPTHTIDACQLHES
jgi:hypothetical protein